MQSISRADFPHPSFQPITQSRREFRCANLNSRNPSDPRFNNQHDSIGATQRIVLLTLDQQFVEHVAHQMQLIGHFIFLAAHQLPPKISNGIATIARMLAMTIAKKTTLLPSQPLRCLPTYCGSFISTRNGSTISGRMTVVSAIEKIVSVIGLMPI